MGINQVRKARPKIHCITNYVTMNDVANAALAAGASPIMAHGIREVEEVTSICDGLVVNIGTLEEKNLEAMIMAGKRAKELEIPIVLDPVGVTASSFRLQAALRLIKEIRPDLIRGNGSEIRRLAASELPLSKENGKNTSGIDASTREVSADVNLKDTKEAAACLAEKTGAMVVVTGETDVALGKDRCAAVRNGHPFMAGITGSGCMLDGILGAFLAAEEKDRWFDAAVQALKTYGVCGERAAKKAEGRGEGLGSFRVYLMDELSLADDFIVEGGGKVEIF